MYRLFFDNYGFREWVYGLAAVVVCVAFLAGMFGGIVFLQTRSCERATAAMGRDGRYDILTKCLVKMNDGTYVPLDNYRASVSESR